MSAPALSVIIPVHNAADSLGEQLDGIASGLHAAPPTEILVVDNGSTDSTVQVARHWAHAHRIAIRVVDASERAGEPHARNAGLAAAAADLVLYCDGDDVVSASWVAAMADGLDHHDWVTGPIDMHRLNAPWIADVRGSSVTGRSLLYDTVPYAHGCNMGFRRSVLEDLGGFDETFRAGCDLDIAVRMWEAGHDLGFVDDAVVAYRLRPSLTATYRQGRFYGRYRVPIRRRLEGRAVVDTASSRTARRVAWLGRNAFRALGSRPTRARWSWVAGQLHGEWQGERDVRRHRARDRG